MKSSFWTLLLVIILSACQVPKMSLKAEAQQSPHVHNRTATIVAVNDMHANLAAFPRFAYMVDSLRLLYPDLLLVSAGDNQTGSPENDLYTPKGLPIIELMNDLRFDLSAVGNHEFDTSPQGFALLQKKATFPFISANIFPEKHTGMSVKPYHCFQLKNGLSLLFYGLLDIEESTGLPAAHPDEMRGVSFETPISTVLKHTHLKDSADALIYLSHLGVENDKKLADALPKGTSSLIIGGHSHTRLLQPIIENGVYITQAERALKYLSLIQLTVHADGSQSVNVQLLPIDLKGRCSEKTATKVEAYEHNNPRLQEQLARSENDIKGLDALGCLMADALCEETGADFAVVNKGGVRMNLIPAGVITSKQIFTLDPFGNEAMLFNLTGTEVHDLFVHGFTDDKNHLLYPSKKLRATYFTEDDDTLVRLTIQLADGSKLDSQKTYKVALNSYIASAFKFNRIDKGINLYSTTAELLINYLKRIQTVPDYNLQNRIKVIDSDD